MNIVIIIGAVSSLLTLLIFLMGIAQNARDSKKFKNQKPGQKQGQESSM